MNFVFSLFSNTSRFGKDGGYQNIGDVFKNGGAYALVGLLTVFVVLAIIWGLLELFHIICHGKKPKKQNAPVIQVPTTPPVPAPASTDMAETAPAQTQDQDDEEIIAVIAAAIAAAQNESPLGSFRVVSFKRK